MGFSKSDPPGAPPPTPTQESRRAPEPPSAFAPTLRRKGDSHEPLTEPSAGPADELSIVGQKVGDFVVTERLGVGGMGVVYAAIQPEIGKAVAIKVLRQEIARVPGQAQRLVAEARALARIHHRGIIDIFTIGQLPDGRHYFVMELLTGESLHELIRRRQRLAVREALATLDEMLAALAAAHEKGIVHRDLKPTNVFLVAQSDGTASVKLLDFGLAKELQPQSRETPQTRTDVFVGTPEYVAPEQARSNPVGPFTDIYSAGVVAFQMLTGRLPFTAESSIDLVLKHLEDPAPAPSRFAEGIPSAVDELILKMLGKDPAARPTIAELRATIAALTRTKTSDGQLSVAEIERFASSGGASYALKLGTRFELGLSWITPALKTLRTSVPARTIHIVFGDSPELLRQIRNAQLDCAVTSARLKEPWLRRMDLHDETYAFVAAPGATFDPARLTLLDVNEELPLFRYFTEAHEPAKGWKFQRTELLGTIAAIRHRALEGDGVAVLPTYFIRAELDSGALVPLFPELPLNKDCFRLVWRDGHPREPEIVALGKELGAVPLK